MSRIDHAAFDAALAAAGAGGGIDHETAIGAIGIAAEARPAIPGRHLARETAALARHDVEGGAPTSERVANRIVERWSAATPSARDEIRTACERSRDEDRRNGE